MRNTLHMKYPAAWHGDMWREAIPVGNGEIGGLVYGGVYHEIISMVHGKLWEGAKTPELPDVTESTRIMRQLLAENKPLEAEYVMSDTMKEKGYQPKTAFPLPLCSFHAVCKNQKAFRHYRRNLHMDRAEATVSWKDGETEYKRKFFVSRADDTAYLEMTASCGTIHAELSLDLFDTESLTDAVDIQNILSEAKENTLYFAAENEGKDYGAVMKVFHNGKSVVQDGKLIVSDATKITGCMKLFIYGEREKEFKQLEKEIIEKSYETALAEHLALHAPLYNAQTLSLGGKDYDVCNEELLLKAYDGEASVELLEKMWSFGRYLLICSSRENGYPCHLYGVWTGNYRATWAFHMYNVNLEMIYWQALPGGMPEMMLSVFDYVEAHMDDYRENAKKMYGARGINIPSVSTPESGLHKIWNKPHILHWTGAAAWIAQFYYDYYLFTGDKEFLEKRAVPFMKEAAAFYEDFLFLGTDGTYVFSPSNSPENTPGNLKDDMMHIRYHEVAVNATMDIALVKELLTNLIKANDILGCCKEKVSVWQDILTHLPEYQINEDGAVKEWTHPFYKDNYEHRHQSHVYPVFPGYEITRAENPTLYRAFERAMELRETVGLKDQSGWSLMYMANVYARMGKGDKAVSCMDYLAQAVLLSNFLTAHNDWRRMGVAMCNDWRAATMQVDANMGLTAAISEMMVFSTEKEIYLYNALPKRFENGAVSPIYTRTGSQISLAWKEKIGTFVLKHQGDEKTVTLICPENATFSDGSKQKKVTLSRGAEISGEIKWNA